MKTELKNIIKLIEPEFETDASHFYNPLPNEVSLYLDSNNYHIDLRLKDDDLMASIWINNQNEYILSEEDIKFIYEHLDSLLDNEIALTKRYYDEEKYEQNRY